MSCYQTLVTIPTLYTTCSTMSPSPTASPFHCKYSVSAVSMYISNSIIYILLLFISGPPGSPQSVSVISVTSSSVVLRWLNPLSVGQPAFVRFSIELATISKVILMSANAVNNTNSSFINTLTMSGLDPNTNYTLCIRTVSTHPAVGELVSDSIMQAITTDASGMHGCLHKITVYSVQHQYSKLPL